jgi:hypothetical protein
MQHRPFIFNIGAKRSAFIFKIRYLQVTIIFIYRSNKVIPFVVRRFFLKLAINSLLVEADNFLNILANICVYF